MSRWIDPARGASGKVTPEDFAVWRALAARAAEAAAGQPSAPVPALAKAAKVAKDTVAPGVVTLENPCIRLSRLARRYAGETTAGRRGLQAELAATAEAANEHLDAEEAPVGAARKDLHA